MWREMRQVLAELEVLSHGSTASWSPSSAGEQTSGNRPPGELHPPHDIWRHTYEKADDDRGRRAALNGARAQLDALRGGIRIAQHRPAGETREERDTRIVRDGAGWPVKDVARKFRCGERDVINARRHAGLDPANGELPAATPVTRPERDARILALEHSGLSQRQIAEQLGVNQATVSRTLRAAA